MSCFLVASTAFGQSGPNFGIIPASASLEKKPGNFVLDKTVVIYHDDDPKMARIEDLLNAFIVQKGGFALRQVKAMSSTAKMIVLTSVGADKLPEEGYTINVTSKKIILTGKDAGLFYAVQSLMQMMPDKQDGKIMLASVEIKDFPRFSYRGTMLDVARNFVPISFIKKYIDLLAQYKINTFHWHLTDDQGWRLQINKYPKLTSVGGFRAGTIIGHYPGIGNDLMPVGGFYTQNEAKEIVKYAADRFITVIPEIEMPGHASAAIAAYPELSCFPDRDTFIGANTPWAGTRKGKLVQQTFGVFDDIFVPSDNTFKFLEDILDEVVEIFPSKYIHIGGDEAPKTYWKESAFAQNLIKEKCLKDEHGLQSYFIQRIEKYLTTKNRKIIGWDEILEGGLAPKATVMSWRGEDGGIASAQQNHDVIMTPGSKGLYIDHSQSNSPDEPVTIGGFSTYGKIYAYDPVPEVLTAEQKKYVIGVQANLWTEYIRTTGKIEYHAFPRLLALAEIAWTPVEKKNFEDFSTIRLPKQLAKLDAEKIDMWIPTPLGQDADTLKGQNFNVDLKVPILHSKIYYTLDQSRPSEISYLYNKPIEISVPKGEKRLLTTIVIAPSGRRSVTKITVLNNGAPDVPEKTKK